MQSLVTMGHYSNGSGHWDYNHPNVHKFNRPELMLNVRTYVRTYVCTYLLTYVRTSCT